MLSKRKTTLLAFGVLAAVSLSACNRENTPHIDYSGTKETDNDQFSSEMTEEEPKSTTADTITDIILTTETIITIETITTNEPVTAVNTEAETLSEETTYSSTSTEEEIPTVTADPNKIYKEDKLLSTRFSEEEINYLHNCAFLGDSTCLGYCRYGFIGDDRVFGNGGVAARNIHTHTFVQKGQEVDFITALKNTGCTELYFLMGMNDVRITSADDYKKNYREMLSEVKEAIPYANIHILSVTPITEYSDFYPNERIDMLNDKLREISEEEGYAFVDTAAAVKNEKGFLIDELCSGDGIHMVSDAYFLMLEVILDSAGF